MAEGYNPLSFLPTTETNLATNNEGLTVNPTNGTDRAPRRLSNRALEPNATLNPRAAAFVPHGWNARPIRLNTLRDLRALMHTGSDDVPLHSVTLFEAKVVGSVAPTVEVRYLPLAKAGHNCASPVDAIDVLPKTKTHVAAARSHRNVSTKPSTQQQSSPIDPINQESNNSHTSVPVSWPMDTVPVELFGMITDYLTCRDIRNMRLACSEFDKKISTTLFKEVVVPFTSELYDMVEEDMSARMGGLRMDHKLPPSELINHRTTGQPNHGLRVFKSFGPHMRRFGIRFDVNEADLTVAPTKPSFNRVQAYHGVYEWPPPGYSRFHRLANLEESADETPRMTAALSSLENVKEVGLSMYNGLGYLSGPDRSHHGIILSRPLILFETEESEQRAHSRDAEDFWSCLEESHRSLSAASPMENELLAICPLQIEDLPTIAGIHYDDTSAWPLLKASNTLGSRIPVPCVGVLYTTSDPREDKFPVSPFNLTDLQNQWILETNWAQDAFLDTYILAVSDNPQIFHQVKKLNITKISSGLLPKLDSPGLWKALPQLSDVTLLVSPDWRTIGKDGAGLAATSPQPPSSAIAIYHAILHRVAVNECVSQLRLGFTDGGEHAQGIFARNANLMPAPLASLDDLFASLISPLSFPHVQTLTLTNCYLTPSALLSLAHSRPVTGTLILDSVSLTAHPLPGSERLDAYVYSDPDRQELFREGSWPAVIQSLSNQQTVRYESCGYAVLPHRHPWDQSRIDQGFGMFRQPERDGLGLADWFRARASVLKPHMMISRDEYLGRIVPWLEGRESAALRAFGMMVGPVGVGMRAEFDGQPASGNGRFWGTVEVRVGDAEADDG